MKTLVRLYEDALSGTSELNKGDNSDLKDYYKDLVDDSLNENSSESDETPEN